jgi:tRNA-splicing ligase RtcB (3'-phosphate/5'-hydroxy nucleic acid ligase)
MFDARAREATFKVLAQTIPRIATRFGSVAATVEVLNDIFITAATSTSNSRDTVAAAQQATLKLSDLVAKKGGVLPDLPEQEVDLTEATDEVLATLFGYQAVWATVAAVTSGQPLAPHVDEFIARRAVEIGSAAHAVATGQALPGSQIPRQAPLATNPLLAARLAQLPTNPRGNLRVVDGIPIWGNHDEATLAQIHRCANDERVVGAAICADGHKGYAIPIGGVLAYENAVSPNGVGFDIGCGMKAVKTDLQADALLRISADGRTMLAKIMDDIQRTIAFGVGRTSGEAVDHELFDDPTWQELREVGRLRGMAAKQLGTVGSGNHFVDIARDEQGTVWILCHFGSRGLGHKTATGYLNLAAGRRWDDRLPGENMDGPAVVLDLDTELGADYMAAMELCGRYAYAGRDFVVEQVRKILGATVVATYHNHHNYAFRERHGDQDLIVVRKGATPAAPGVWGIVGGSMGTPTAIVRGVDGPEAAVGFYSAPHGSGRVMSRTQAAGKRDRKTGRQLSPGRVTPEMLHAAVTARGIELRGGGLDESPHAYRDPEIVLAAHDGAIEVVERLYPMGVAMAGEGEFDPFKD